MGVRNELLGALGVIVMVTLAGCAAKQAGTHPGTQGAATDVPDHFMAWTADGPVEPQPGGTCRNPLVDPRDETRLTLIRSADGRGDYQPEPLRYGLSAGELLRVDCATGRVVGVVKR
jgi:hypothetical protein